MIRKLFRISAWATISVILIIILINVWVVLRTKSRIYTNTADVPNTPVGMVLGTSERIANGNRNVFFDTRMDAAAELYKSGKVKKLIVSGDNSVSNYNETEAMRKALVKRGVPEKDIVEDFAGFRTLDSVVRTKSVFGQESIVVISQRFHIQRAIFIADAKGLKATGFVADDPAHRGPFFKVMAREWLARVAAVLDCYILRKDAKFPGPPEPIQFTE